MTRYFWQLSGHSGHIHYDWRTKIETIADIIYDMFAIKGEEGMLSLELVLGIEESGASHILMPSDWHAPKQKKEERNFLSAINWKHSGRHLNPYPSSRYASLSPIRIDSALRLASLLEKRQNVAKGTKAGRLKADTSKANARFLDGQPNLNRAAFEHARCLWRILHDKLNPESYGLSPAPWSKSLVVFSLAFNFWQPDGVKTEPDCLLDAAVAKLVLPSKENGNAESTMFHFKVEEMLMHRNPFQREHQNIPEIWQTRIIPMAQVCQEIQKIIDYDSVIEGNLVTPVVILTYRYNSWLREQLTALGLRNSEWNRDISKLLGYAQYRQPYKEEEDEKRGVRGRARSRSPIARSGSFTESLPRIKREHSPQPTQAPAIYVVDVLETFKTASGSEPSTRTRPVDIYFKVTGQHYPETGYAGDDADCILQVWKRLVEGPSLIDQNTLFEGDAINANLPRDPIHEETRNQSETAEAPNLYAPNTNNREQTTAIRDIFNESDSEDDY